MSFFILCRFLCSIVSRHYYRFLIVFPHILTVYPVSFFLFVIYVGFYNSCSFLFYFVFIWCRFLGRCRFLNISFVSHVPDIDVVLSVELLCKVIASKQYIFLSFDIQMVNFHDILVLSVVCHFLICLSFRRCRLPI